MKVCGVIVEYNPLHNGHIYHLKKAKKVTGADVVIAVMSSNFVQRGEPAIISKEKRIESALNNGVDVVLELPSFFALQSADYFARSAVLILDKFGVSDICFGSETGNSAAFYKKYEKVLKNKKLKFKKEMLQPGLSYPKAFEKTFFKDCKQKPNDILGINYIRTITNENLKINWHSIKRTSTYHSKELEEVASATSIRDALKRNEDVKKHTPLFRELDNTPHASIENLFKYLKFELITKSKKNLRKIHLVDEGIENLFLKNIKKANNMESFISMSTSKRYTSSRIKRTIMHILLNNEKKEIKRILKTPQKYVRILGFNKHGQKYLSKIRDKTISIINFDKNNLFLQKEKKASYVFDLATHKKTSCYENEHKLFPIIKK